MDQVCFRAISRLFHMDRVHTIKIRLYFQGPNLSSYIYCFRGYETQSRQVFVDE